MKVFLSHSGAKSRAAAEAFGPWLSHVIQAVEPWISSDMDKGDRWPQQVAGKLEDVRVGIICLARDNLTAPWILFEAGALSKTKDASVCTLLIDLRSADVGWPLAQFQHTEANRDDVLKLVKTINKKVSEGGEKALSDQTLSDTFEKWWPELEGKLKTVIAAGPSASRPVRSDREILEEMLELLRSIAATGPGLFASFYGREEIPEGLGLRDWAHNRASFEYFGDNILETTSPRAARLRLGGNPSTHEKPKTDGKKEK